MVLTPVERNGVKILLAEGRVDAGLPDRLEAALAAHPGIAEIWLSSPGGDARAGNEAGRIIRRNLGLTTRIPSGSACFSACNFVFMGGIPRYVDPGRSEERRVGKECGSTGRSRWSPIHKK